MKGVELPRPPTTNANVDVDRRLVKTRTGWVVPPRKTFQLCVFLSRSAGYAQPRDACMDAIGISEDRYVGALASVVKRARMLGIENIVTYYGIGYAWIEGPDPKQWTDHSGL